MSDTQIETDWHAGAQTPERAKELADGFAETVRALTYGTKAGAGGLEYPSHVYDLLGNLYIGTGRLPQLFDQLHGFIRALEQQGRLRHDQGEDVRAAVAELGAATHDAGLLAERLTAALQKAQNAISALSYKSEG